MINKNYIKTKRKKILKNYQKKFMKKKKKIIKINQISIKQI